MQLLWLIPILPLAGFAVNGLFGRKMPKSMITLVAVGSVLLSFAWAVKTLLALQPLNQPYVERYFTWFSSGSLNVGFDLMVDRLTAVMLLVVTGVGSLIHIYSIGYMHAEDGYYRFFAFLNLFMFFMLTLVMGANFLVLFVGWEGVGLCSYLLIGYYFVRDYAADAGKKAFIVNRIGDFGFSLAMFLIFAMFGSLDFGRVFAAAASKPVESAGGALTLICFLLLLGATGKSAQIPLYVWLPDAMAGPTPVSALIHAATMVTAGVYMTARSAALFLKAPMAMDAVAIIGIVTAFMAATIGLTQFDIKKVFAYSTVSQLGYMFVGVGVGAFDAGIFHVMTHAFFKALLFLGAGAVIHGLHDEQDMRNMGGLRKHMPIACWTLFIASLAIAGVPGFSGYFSKDEILIAAHGRSPMLYWLGVITAGMTAFYVFRAWFMTFLGRYRGQAHPHESPLVMTVPLMVLAALSAGGGFIPVPHILAAVLPAAHAGHHDPSLAIIAAAAGLIGIGLAYLFYVVKPGLPGAVANGLGGLYRLVCNKYYVDEIYDHTVVQPIKSGSETLLWKVTDVGLVDGIVNGLGRLSASVGGGLRTMQSGNIRSYAAWVVFGSLLVLVFIGMAGGAR
ncbi:MAG: NADH-quinone oxidoreductase subunit L [Bryobacterales bacterium]|nr:NADH-quinone oxidoreductase subunit L [Bryobacterales bacterium]